MAKIFTNNNKLMTIGNSFLCKYEPPVYNVTYSTVANGTLSGPNSAHENDTINVTATPSTNYILDYLTVNGSQISGTSFSMPGQDTIVSGAFKSNIPAYDGYWLNIYDDYYNSMTTMAIAGIYYNGTSSSDVVPLANIPYVDYYNKSWTKTTLTSNQINQARQPNVGLTLNNVMFLEMRLSGFATTPNNISIRFTSGFTRTSFTMELWGYYNNVEQQTLLYKYPKGSIPAGTYTFNIWGN